MTTNQAKEIAKLSGQYIYWEEIAGKLNEVISKMNHTIPGTNNNFIDGAISTKVREAWIHCSDQKDLIAKKINDYTFDDDNEF